ncbi:MAG: hypothetical protein ACXWWU_04305 [Candidatus Limnocylindria bacterium]
MPLPVALAATYFAVNLAITIWLVREETRGRAAPGWLVATSRTLRFGPPLIGLLYLVTRAGDWPFVLFVAAFFASAFWLLDGLLNYPTRPPK